MALIKAQGHVGVRCFDQDAARRFYCDILGLKPNTQKTNWLGFEGGPAIIHLMPPGDVSGDGARTENRIDLANHLALEVDSLRDLVGHLRAAGFELFQTELDASKRRPIHSAEDDLKFGIGTVFTFDPDGNVVEFFQRDFGIYATVPDESR